MDNSLIAGLAKKVQPILGRSALLCWIDKKIYDGNVYQVSEPVFIVGAPRVGSTIIFQALVAKYKFSYLTNLHSLFFNQVCFADCLCKIFRFAGVKYSHSFHSKYGYSDGLLAPSEAGPVFRLWFGEADYVQSANNIDPIRVRKNIATLCKSSRTPFLSKNLFNSMRLQKILECYPKAFLVWVQRDHDKTRKSILKMRKNLHGDIEKWASVNIPHQDEIIKMNAERQVDEQIKAITKYIEKIFLNRDSKFNCIVSYESFCENPDQTLVSIAKRYDLATQYRLIPTQFPDEIKISKSSE